MKKHKHILRILASASAAIALSSCASVPLTVAYINDDVAGHSVAGSVTFGGKAPKATLALTKRNSALLADSGK